MNPPGFIIAILLIIFGSVLLGKVLGLVKFWIEKRHESKKNELISTPEFLQALREFKEKTDRRLTDVEAFISEWKEAGMEDGLHSSGREERIRPKEQGGAKIMLPENEDIDDNDADRRSETSGDQVKDKNLQNMLNKS